MGSFLVLLAVSTTLPSVRAEDRVNFNRDVRPIFAKHCTACHGGVKAASDLSFVYRDTVLGVVDIDDPGESELIRRLQTEDDDERMPPPESAMPKRVWSRFSAASLPKSRSRRWRSQACSVSITSLRV